MHHHYEVFFFAFSCAIKCNQGTRGTRVPWQEISGTYTVALVLSTQGSLLGLTVFQATEMLSKETPFKG